MLPPNAPERWMRAALKEAESAFEEGETPVGAVIADLATGQLLARAHGQTRALNDPTAHALMIALSQLSGGEVPADEMGFMDLDEAAALGEMEPATPSAERQLAAVLTHEPCAMCAGALLLIPGMRHVVIGAPQKHSGALGSACDLTKLIPDARGIMVLRGVLEAECQALLVRAQKK